MDSLYRIFLTDLSDGGDLAGGNSSVPGSESSPRSGGALNYTSTLNATSNSNANPNSAAVFSVETLLLNMQELLKAAIESAREKERKLNYDKSKSLIYVPAIVFSSDKVLAGNIGNHLFEWLVCKVIEFSKLFSSKFSLESLSSWNL